VSLEQLFGTATIVPCAAGVEIGALARYRLLDRGSYEYGEAAVPAEAVELAARATGRSLAVREARLLCLRAGDYLLARHDRLRDDNPVEIVLDLSPAVVAGAEVHYRRRGRPFFRVPSAPGSLSIVERGPTVTCNHTYISRLVPDALVLRLVALLG
jgi:hypothetical protein